MRKIILAIILFSSFSQYSISQSGWIWKHPYPQGHELNSAQTLVNEKLFTGGYEVEFSGNNFPSGIYFYSLKAGDFSQVKKMILLK